MYHPDGSHGKAVHREVIEALNRGISKKHFDRQFKDKSVCAGMTAHRFVELMREAGELRPLRKSLKLKTPALL